MGEQEGEGGGEEVGVEGGVGEDEAYSYGERSGLGWGGWERGEVEDGAGGGEFFGEGCEFWGKKRGG